MMMTTKEIANGLVKKYQSLLGKKQKTPFGYLPIEDIKPVEWESGHFYDVFLISYHQSEDSEATDEIRTSLFDFLDKMGLLDTFPDQKTNPDPQQKYFLPRIVSFSFNLLKTKRLKRKMDSAVSSDFIPVSKSKTILISNLKSKHLARNNT